MIQNKTLDKDDPLYFKLINLLKIRTKEDFIEIRNRIKNGDILKNMIENKIIDYSYLI